MSKKRTSAESKNESSESLSQNEDNAKRAKLDSLSDTQLQDIPIEMLERILMKAVTMEVKGLKLVKSVWKAKADLVISRLRTVCLQWTSILTTDFFRNEVYRTLDGTVQNTIRLEILHESRVWSAMRAMTTMNDEVFTIDSQGDRDYGVYVYQRHNMVKVKDVIRLPMGADPMTLAACSVSNCVYVGLQNVYCLCHAVIRISKSAEHQFNMSQWTNDQRSSFNLMALSVTTKGEVLILSVLGGEEVVSIFNANGSLQYEIMLSSDIDANIYQNVMQKANGNLVLTYSNNQNYQPTLLEIDMSGSIVRKYQSSISTMILVQSYVNFADVYGRVMITEPNGRIELLDPEFNRLGVYSLQQDKGKTLPVSFVHYDSERNEIVRDHYDRNAQTSGLIIFRFTEE